MDSNPPSKAFYEAINKREFIFLLIYFPFHFFILPYLLELIDIKLNLGINTVDLTVIYYSIGLILLIIFTFNFLKNDFNTLIDRLFHNIIQLIISYFFMVFLTVILSYFITMIDNSLENLNNSAIIEMAETQTGKTTAVAVFMAPIVEEILFRGLIFKLTRSKSIYLAFIVSILFFGFYHVWQYVFLDVRYLFLIIEYIPATFALCWSYEKSGSIWCPIFLHMYINYQNIMLLS